MHFSIEDRRNEIISLTSGERALAMEPNSSGHSSDRPSSKSFLVALAAKSREISVIVTEPVLQRH